MAASRLATVRVEVTMLTLRLKVNRPWTCHSQDSVAQGGERAILGGATPASGYPAPADTGAGSTTSAGGQPPRLRGMAPYRCRGPAGKLSAWTLMPLRRALISSPRAATS